MRQAPKATSCISLLGRRLKNSSSFHATSLTYCTVRTSTSRGSKIKFNVKSFWQMTVLQNVSTQGQPPHCGKKRSFRGFCRYKSGKCKHERARKRNGAAHTLCEVHRLRHNAHQRKSDRKHRLAKATQREHQVDYNQQKWSNRNLQPPLLPPLRQVVPMSRLPAAAATAFVHDIKIRMPICGDGSTTFVSNYLKWHWRRQAHSRATAL